MPVIPLLPLLIHRETAQLGTTPLRKRASTPLRQGTERQNCFVIRLINT